MTVESKHPYGPFIPEGADKLIIGTIPPYRFCQEDELFSDDVNFYYGSKDNYFWEIMSEITGSTLHYENTEDAIMERKDILTRLHTGVTDIVECCIHKNGKSSDSSLEIITTKDIARLLSDYPNIQQLIYTSKFVASQMYNKLNTCHSWCKENKSVGSIMINGKRYGVHILISPSPQALRRITKEERIERYKTVFGLR